MLLLHGAVAIVGFYDGAMFFALFFCFYFAGRSRPLRGLKRSRQERHSKDAAKLLLLYDENILDNDPHRESKDTAFAQSYLNRVR